jgi:hypothetical protein
LVSLGRLLRPGAWLALVAMLALVLAPTVSRAMAADPSGPIGWGDVCVSDPSRATPDVDAPTAPGHTDPSVDHCSMCLLSGGTLGPPPTLVSLAITGLSDGPPGLFLRASTPSHAWRAAQPRGPPPLA